MKRLVATVSLIAVAAVGHAQTTATNFTATDCKGASHTLFTELDAGKTVVMVWVMPCGACMAATENAYTAVKNYAAAHPGKVLYYLISDYGDDLCADLELFGKGAGAEASKISVFENTGKVIDQASYGGNGMPHVVVVSGTDHKIWYNEKNGTAAGITEALNKATGISEVAQTLSFSMSPNPVTDVLNIKYDRAISKVTILSVSGQLVKEFNFEGGRQNPAINIWKLPAGNYMIKVQDADGRSGLQQIVKL